MSRILPMFARTTSLMDTNMMLSQLRGTQRQLLDVQRQIATGKRYGQPSDAPARTSTILFLQQQLASRTQYNTNLQHALGMLNNVDAALADANDILLDAKSTALGQVGVGSDADTRRTTSLIVDAQIRSLMEIGNRQFNRISLFGGNGGAAPGDVVFEEFLGGVRYLGSEDNLQTDGDMSQFDYTSNGVAAFGSLSARVKSQIDLNPGAASDTRIANIGGATLEGVALGSINLNVDGTEVSVDLNSVDSLGDVVTRINDAINTLDPTAGSLAISGNGFELTAAAGHSITVSDIGSGRTASDLGIELASAGGVPTAGPDLNIKLTETTLLTDLGAAIDWASGLSITHGNTTKVADFSTAQTVQDMMNVIDQLNLGLRLEINDQQNGLNLVSEVSGVELSIGENGGTTAADLGLRTFGTDTLLADFRHGLGIEPIEGEDDFAITLHDGTQFNVNLDGATTVGDVITKVQAAATAAGLTIGMDFDIDLATTGNGFVFTDNTVGGGDFVIENVGLSVAADQLGISQNAGAAGTITTEDLATVRVDSFFSDLIDLRNALQNNDESGITLAGSRLEDALSGVARARASVGVEARRIEDEQLRSEDRELAEKTMLSEVQDADLTEVITKYMQLQQQLQASLQTGAQNLQLSLLDFLR